MSVVPLQTQVAIIGAGPVGLTIAMDLAMRGIDVVVIEQRGRDDAADAKCNTVAARTMEVFRRLGIADAVRAAGLPDDFVTDVIFTTAISGKEITRIRQPSRAERLGDDGRSAPGFHDSHWPTPEPVVRISQIFLNPILADHAQTFEKIRICYKTQYDSHEDLGHCVRVHAHALDGEVTVDARFLIGCDGGNSAVRKQLGTKLEGDAKLARIRTSFVRAPDLLGLFPKEPAWMSWVINPRCSGTVVAIDGRETWLIHRNLPNQAREFSELDADQSIRDVLGVPEDFRWEVIHHQDWTGRRLVARNFRRGNVFIAGDAAHLWIPYAGYGMNAGIADGANLAWMLAAVLQGYAPDQLLNAHETERHPITEQVSHLAMRKAMELAQQSSARKIPKVLESSSPVGWFVRRKLGKKLYDINVPQFACGGLNFGYYYDSSPIIAYDGHTAPAYDMQHAAPSTVPGCRLPHVWLDDDTSIYDALGDYYTLLHAPTADPGEEIVQAFAALDMPLTLLALPEQHEHIEHRYLIVRSDQHVAWRGNELPTDASWLARKLSAHEK